MKYNIFTRMLLLNQANAVGGNRAKWRQSVHTLDQIKFPDFSLTVDTMWRIQMMASCIQWETIHQLSTRLHCLQGISNGDITVSHWVSLWQISSCIWYNLCLFCLHTFIFFFFSFPFFFRFCKTQFYPCRQELLNLPWVIKWSSQYPISKATM